MSNDNEFRVSVLGREIREEGKEVVRTGVIHHAPLAWSSGPEGVMNHARTVSFQSQGWVS